MGALFVRFVLPGLFFLGAIYAAIQAVREYAVERFVRTGEKIISPHDAVDFLKAEKRDTIRSAEALRVKIQLFLLAAQDVQSSAEDRVNYLCMARDSAFEMYQLRPMDSETHARLAYLESLQEIARCEGERMDAAPLIEAALNHGRRNPRVLMFAARIASLRGDFKATVHFLHDFLALRTVPTALDRKFIYQTLESENVSLTDVFPQDPYVYAIWIKLLSDENPGLLSFIQDRVNNQFQMLLNQASTADLATETSLLHEIYFLPQLVASRQAMNRYFGRISPAEGNEQRSTFFTSLTDHVPLQLLPGYIPVDSFPGKNPLRNWGASRMIALDSRKRSAGFYLASEQPVKIIDIVSRASTPRNNLTSLLKVYVSSNNYEWNELTGKVTIKRLAGQGFQALRLSFPETTGHYWKIHNAGMEGDEAFYGPLDMFIQAYGS